MITEDINRDKLIADIDQQIQTLPVIAQDNPILTEQLGLRHEAREAVLNQQPKIARLADWSHFSRFKLSELYFDGESMVDNQTAYEDIVALSAGYSWALSNRWSMSVTALI